jgi:hypothetical protein
MTSEVEAIVATIREQAASVPSRAEWNTMHERYLEVLNNMAALDRASRAAQMAAFRARDDAEELSCAVLAGRDIREAPPCADACRQLAALVGDVRPLIGELLAARDLNVSADGTVTAA